MAASKANESKGQKTRLEKMLQSIASNAAIAGVIGSIGDMLMQKVEGKETMDVQRTVRLACYRGLIFGPLYSIWLNRVSVLPLSTPAKVLLDQGIWTPPALGSFYFCMSTFEGNSVDASIRRVREQLWPTLLLNWPIWIGVQGLTYGFIPQRFRVAFVSIIQVAWNAVLSSLNETARMGEHDE